MNTTYQSTTLRNLIKAVEKVLPKAVKEVNSVINRPYWGTVNIGEAFERILSGYCNEDGFGNDCEGKKGGVVDLYFHIPAMVQVKTTHPKTKEPKSSFQFCRTPSTNFEDAVQDVRGKFFQAFKQYQAREFFLLHHDFKNRQTTIYLLATKDSRVKFHGDFLSGERGCMSKDYIMVPKSDLMKVWEKVW